MMTGILQRAEGKISFPPSAFRQRMKALLPFIVILATVASSPSVLASCVGAGPAQACLATADDGSPAVHAGSFACIPMSEGEGCAAALSLTCDGSQDASGTLSTPQWTCGSAGVTCPGGTGAC